MEPRAPRTFVGENFTGTVPDFTAGDALVDCNCAQTEPFTPFGVPGMRFTRCNLINCRLPKDAVLSECNSSHFVDTDLDRFPAGEQDWDEILKQYPAGANVRPVIEDGELSGFVVYVREFRS